MGSRRRWITAAAVALCGGLLLVLLTRASSAPRGPVEQTPVVTDAPAASVVETREAARREALRQFLTTAPQIAEPRLAPPENNCCPIPGHMLKPVSEMDADQRAMLDRPHVHQIAIPPDGGVPSVSQAVEQARLQRLLEQGEE